MMSHHSIFHPLLDTMTNATLQGKLDDAKHDLSVHTAACISCNPKHTAEELRAGFGCDTGTKLAQEVIAAERAVRSVAAA